MNSEPAIFSSTAYAGARALVLGAAGFIGRWVARRLTALDAQLHLVVRDPAAAAAVFRRYGIVGQVQVVELCDKSAVRCLLARVRPAITFNMVGYGVDPTECDETTAYDINLKLVETVADAITATRDPAWPGLDLVHVGSALEYGAIPGDLSEDSQPNPTTLYGRSKLAGTRCVDERCTAGDLRAVTARLFTVYGPGEHAGRLLRSLMEAARTGQPLALTAGRQRRDFTYVEDVAEGLVRLGLVGQDRFSDLAQPGAVEDPAQRVGVVNLATGRLTAVREFVAQGAAVLGIRDDCLLFEAIPTRAEEMQHDPVSLHRLRHLLDWTPPTTIPDGIRRTWLFEQESLEAAVHEH